MSKTNVYVFRGTGESLNAGMCWTVAGKLNKNKYNVVEIRYPATIGPVGGASNGVSLNKSLEVASQLLADQVRQHGPNYAVVGYSLGALATSRIMEDIAGGRLRIAAPKWAVQIANPARNPGHSARALCASNLYGIHGKHEPYPTSTHVIELASGRDMITATPENSPIRLLSYLVSPFELIAQKDAENKGYDLIGLLNKVRREDWLSWIRRGNYAEALNGIIGYLVPWGIPPRNQHTLYNIDIMPGTGKTWTDWAVSEVTTIFG